MPDPKFVKPWHGIARESIDWRPIVAEDACIGCGVCVTTCGRQVYRFDFERKKAIVAEPTQCAVGCTTCANICPTHAIHFPSLDQVLDILSQPDVRSSVLGELKIRHDQIDAQGVLPHPDRIVKLVVENVASAGKNGVIVNLTPKTSVDWLCQFTPGDYLEIWSPSNPWIARAYSIDNAPRDDGKIEVELRRPPKGRLGETGGIVDLNVGDEVLARGPLGHFHIRSPIDVPLLFIARGPGFAPIKSMIEHQLRLAPDRDVALLWDLNDTDDLHHLDMIRSWSLVDKRFRCVISSMRVDDQFTPPEGLVFSVGTIRETLDLHPELDPAGRDVYLAGPRRFNNRVLEELERMGAPRDRIVIETVGD